MKHKILDLFSGIGGFSLGLEATGGFETVAFCEDNEPAQKVLAKHWPDVPIYGDIKELRNEQLQADGIRPTVITGGFPCTDISNAGPKAGIVGERSGLWQEMFRLVGDVRPAWVIVENVSALRSRGLTLVLQNLCSLGYVCEWHCIAARAVGALHERDRIWIVAYTEGLYARKQAQRQGGQGAFGRGSYCRRGQGEGEASAEMAHAQYSGSQGQGTPWLPRDATPVINREAISSVYGRVRQIWATEPSLGRVADGVPCRVDRLKQLGNAVVPHIPMLIGEAILAKEANKATGDDHGGHYS